VGLLGEVGGLTNTEHDYFLSQLNQRFLTDTQTTIIQSQRSLPNYGELVHSYGDLIRDMLAPLPKDRPDANKVLSKLVEFEDQLHPELNHFKLAHSADHLPLTVSLGKPLAISLDIKGKGLPTQLDWLEIKINDYLIRDIESQLINSLPSPENENEYLYYYRIYLPVFEDASIEHYTLYISGTVNGKEKTIVKDINVVIDPNYLWQQGQRIDALKLSPKALWLDEWEKSAKTVEEKSELINVIKELKELHSDLTTSLNERAKRINNHKPMNPKFYIISSIIIIFLSIIIYLLLSKARIPDEPHQTGISLTEEVNVINNKEVDQKHNDSAFFNAAQQGDAKAQYELGYLYVNDRNYDEAMKWYLKSAKQQYAPAQAGVGWLYYIKDTQESDKKAVEWFRLAVEQNNADGQYLLGLMYAKGRGGLPKDSQEAERWYQRAADQGHSQAKDKLNK